MLRTCTAGVAKVQVSGLGEQPAGLARGPGGDGDGELGGHREPVDGVAVGLEAQGAGADPLPAARDLGGEGDGHVGGVELFEGAEGHHRLAERDAQRRGDRHLALGLEAQDLERPGRDLLDGGGLGYGERLVDRLADDRRREGLGRAVEVGGLVGHVPGPEAIEDGVGLAGPEACALDDRRGGLVVGPADGLAGAETDRQRPRPSPSSPLPLTVAARPPASARRAGRWQVRDRPMSCTPTPRGAPRRRSSATASRRRGEGRAFRSGRPGSPDLPHRSLHGHSMIHRRRARHAEPPT